MTQKEKKLLWFFLVILGVGVIARGIPSAITSYQSGVEDIENLKEKRKKLKKLEAREEYWRVEFEKNNKKEKQLLKQLFVGTSPELIAARVQRKLKGMARQSDIKVDSMNLPDLKHTDGWLLISQTMSFKAPTDQLMKLLEQIKKSKPALIVTDIQVRSYRKVLNCTIKVVGFSRTVSEQGSES